VFTIGEFSRITGLSIKALRIYHERKLLIPAHVEKKTGYRYYRPESVDKARTIAQLRAMTFSLEEINTIVGACDDEADIVSYLQEKGDVIARKMANLQHVALSIETIVHLETEAALMSQKNEFEVEEKELDDVLIASTRWTGRYDQAGAYFTKLYKSIGRYACGKPMALYYDDEYKTENADIESCVPVRKATKNGDIGVRKLSGGKCISLIHKGPYTELTRSYAKLMNHAKDHTIEVQLPTREVYKKGPGMIFKGNPNNYITEIQFMLV